MRAFMSPVFDRTAAVNGRDVAIFADLARVPVHPPTAAGWAREADREACAILAETEGPDAIQAGGHGINVARNMRPGATALVVPYAALAEALAAFVADGPQPAGQTSIAGTTRPESRPTIRTEGREADGPLFTQDRDARDRAEQRSQRRIF